MRRLRSSPLLWLLHRRVVGSVEPVVPPEGEDASLEDIGSVNGGSVMCLCENRSCNKHECSELGIHSNTDVVKEGRSTTGLSPPSGAARA
eukprot:31631-Eustigmatos_ZCMA.PRE.1